MTDKSQIPVIANKVDEVSRDATEIDGDRASQVIEEKNLNPSHS